MKLAIVVQRYGPEVIGGSESLARQYAQHLSARHQVEVLTTCAADHRSWANHFPAGLSHIDGIPVRRFGTDFERSRYWSVIYDLLLARMDERAFPGSPDLKLALGRRLAGWPRALQEEVIRWQGPYSKELFNYLAAQARTYDAFLFCTYLFPTTYFGMQRIGRRRLLFCPTLHDEPIAYLPVFRSMFRLPSFTIYLTEAERSLARRLYAADGESDVIGMSLSLPESVGSTPAGTPSRYLLYAGRIEPSKGTTTLVEYFLAYKRRHRSDLKLVLIGTPASDLARSRDVIYLGFVSEAEKFALMQRAQAFVHPSPFESFSIVLLESFLMGTPALVNGANDVLLEHCRRSGAGLAYGSAEEFGEELHKLLVNQELRARMGDAGRRYVEEHYLGDRVRDRLLAAMECLASGAGLDRARAQMV
jgi:glycosyltransferase involved in cell wall biosynthesis